MTPRTFSLRVTLYPSDGNTNKNRNAALSDKVSDLVYHLFRTLCELHWLQWPVVTVRAH